ncbi:transposase [Desulfopila sp. IMCC35008]|uniref:transposase n=1 Tax=Desulfopila sp. IMCC35008 TaxID=2653858 RepID=UPI0013D25BCA|nr:transposase [Desulfopila sp. IMCC35008]
MPRPLRIIFPNTPHHITQRGYNHQPVFHYEEDYQTYLSNLLTFKKQFNCKIYAYCLMSNHVHLVINPGDNPDSISNLMQRVAGRQTHYRNVRYNRRGSLWEGRFKCTHIPSLEYLLACYCYIDLNPFHAGIVKKPQSYRWSSCSAHITDECNPILDTDIVYQALGDSQKERAQLYLEYLRNSVKEEKFTNRGQA